jgi:hypothetical protein
MDMSRKVDARRLRPLAATLVLAALAGCSAEMPSMPKFELGLTRPDVNFFAKDEKPTKQPVTAEELIGADGRCAGDAAGLRPSALNFQAGPAAPGSPPPPGPAEGAAPGPVRTGVGLGMSECDVVRALGVTDRIEMSSTERGERSLVLTYPKGSRPGVYRFVAGRLTSIERVPDAAPSKPARGTPRRQAPS